MWILLVVVPDIPRFLAISVLLLITCPRGRGRLNLLHGYLSLICFLGSVSSLSPYLTTQLNLTSVQYFTNARALVYHLRFKIWYSYGRSHFNMYLYKYVTHIFLPTRIFVEHGKLIYKLLNNLLLYYIDTFRSVLLDSGK